MRRISVQSRVGPDISSPDTGLYPPKVVGGLGDLGDSAAQHGRLLGDIAQEMAAVMVNVMATV